MPHDAIAEFEFTAMASPCRIRLAGLPQARAGQLAEQAVAEVRRIEQMWSRYRPDSVVSRINAAAGQASPIDVDPETAGLIHFGALLHAQTDGAFDLTSGVWRRAWDFRRAQLPAAERLAELRPLVGWPQVEWDGHRLRLPRAGMELDLGGLGKEYAVDRAASLLIDGGANSGVVNLGGDLRVLGPRPDGGPWQIGIAHPRQPGHMAFDWPLWRGALATSGDYERCIVVDGRRYGHILDARSGWPVSYWQSVSVAGPACLAAGALTTTALLLGEPAIAFLAQQGLPWVGIAADGQVIDQRGA